MNKLLPVILSALLLFGAVGCNNDEDENIKDITTAKAPVSDVITVSEEETEVQTVEQTAEQTENNETDITETDSEVKTGVSVYTEHYMQGECSVTIMYPRYGDTDHSAFDLSMRNVAVQEFNQNGILPEDSAVYEITSCDIKYESDHFVSAVIIGQLIYPGAAHDNHFAYTVNADPRDGKVYLSSDLVENIETVKSAVADGKFTQAYGIDGLMDEVTPEVITASWRSDYQVFPDMYFTKDSFGIMAELPYAVGGYGGFEIPYADTEDMINPVAKGLAGIIVTTD